MITPSVPPAPGFGCPGQAMKVNCLQAHKAQLPPQAHASCAKSARFMFPSLPWLSATWGMSLIRLERPPVCLQEGLLGDGQLAVTRPLLGLPLASVLLDQLQAFFMPFKGQQHLAGVSALSSPLRR